MAEKGLATRATGVWLSVITFAVTSLGMIQPATAANQAAPHTRYRDTGLDPNDVPIDQTSCCQQDPDIRRSTRKVWVDARSRSWLTVSFATYEPLDDYWHLVVFLDTRGGPRFDATMSIFDPGTGAPGCTFIRRGSTRRDAKYRDTDDQAFCRIPLAWAESTKRIRWRLFSRGGGEGTGPAVDEHAPDTGWYV